MFRAHVLIVRKAKLYYTVSAIITPIGGRPVHSPLSTCAPSLFQTEAPTLIIITLVFFFF